MKNLRGLPTGVYLQHFIENYGDDCFLIEYKNKKIGLDLEKIVTVFIEKYEIICNYTIGYLQQVVKEICFCNQNHRDPYTKNNFNFKDLNKMDLHHALITRNDIKSVKDIEKRILIHNPLNCIVVDHQTHIKHPKIQDRYYNAKLLLNIYGEANKGVLERFLLDFPIQTTIKNYYSNLGTNNA